MFHVQPDRTAGGIVVAHLPNGDVAAQARQYWPLLRTGRLKPADLSRDSSPAPDLELWPGC
jgi:hypothetical protein